MRIWVYGVLRHAMFCSFLLTPWCRVLLEKLTGLQLVKKLAAFHGTRRFITALTSVRHLSLSWASPIQSIYPNPTSWRSILILSTHLRLGLPSGLFSLRFPHQDPIHPPLLTHTRHMPSPSHPSRFYHPHYITILYYYGTTVVYVVRRWPKHRYAAHTCILYFKFFCLFIIVLCDNLVQIP